MKVFRLRMLLLKVSLKLIEDKCDFIEDDGSIEGADGRL